MTELQTEAQPGYNFGGDTDIEGANFGPQEGAIND